SCINFFFSSRRRHTISKRDWSSDVCSSDLCTHSSPPNIVMKSFYDALAHGYNCQQGNWSMEKLGSARTKAVDPRLDWHEIEYPRSEERRVGKDRRSRWVGNHS